MRALILLLSIFLYTDVYALDIEIESENAIVYDITEQNVIYEKDSKEKVSVASLTKIATAIVAIEGTSNLDEELKINFKMLSGIPWDASVLGLKMNDVVTVRDLLYGTILSSGADCAQALAIAASNSIDAHVTKMNALSKKLKLKNTHFTNVTGLDDAFHKSSAYDLIKLLEYALKNETFKEIFTTKNYTLKNGKEAKTTLYYYNSYLNLDLNRILGSKTGFTSDAGLCLGTYFNSHGHDLISIVLGAPINKKEAKNIVDTMNLIIHTDGVLEELQDKIDEKNEYVKRVQEERKEIKKAKDFERNLMFTISSIYVIIDLYLIVILRRRVI